MCDCTNGDDSEPKIQVCQPPFDNDDLQSDATNLCDCKREDDSEPKMIIATSCLPSNAIESCDCTSSESSTGSTKSCDCTSDGSSERNMEICDDTATDKQDHAKSSFAIVQVELSKSMLNLLPETESSTSCDCTSATGDSQDKSICSTTEEASCDCTSESSQSSQSEGKEKKLEWTLAIIKPEALIFRREIERIIEEEEGFGICQRRWLHLTAEQVSEFYCDNYEQKDFARLIAYMSSKPIAVYVLCKLDAITEWRLLIGPTKVSDARLYAPDSIRGRYGTKGDDMQNAVHGSFDERAAEREIRFFFPDSILEPLLRDEAAEQYLWRTMNDVLSEGLVECCEEKPEDPVVWLGNWLLDRKRPKYLLRSTSNLND